MIADLNQFALDSIETPTWILFGKSYRQVDDLLSDSRSAGFLFFAIRIVPLLGDQCSMPSKESIWCEPCADFLKCLATEDLTLDREAPSLVVAKQDSFLPELFLEYLVL